MPRTRIDQATARFGRLRPLNGAMLILGLLAPALLTGAGLPEGGARDITATKAGQAMLQRMQVSTAAFAAPSQVNAPGETLSSVASLKTPEYLVFTGVEGDEAATWVVPAGQPLPEVKTSATSTEVSKVSVQTVAVPTPVADTSTVRRPVADASATRVAAAGGSIKWQSPYCYARYTETGGWFDHCRQFGSIAYDGDSSRDHWVLKQYGTCKSTSGWQVGMCKLSSTKKSGSTTQYWEDWAPRADSNGKCRSISLAVTAGVVNVGGSYDACETNDITKGSAAGSFTSAWTSIAKASTERGVQSQIAVGVPNGKVPAFSLGWDLTAYVRI
ncbi:hypothetical protein [Pseudokineococcus sp. 1T1Z-3]|uniref:hypothetical protein n=1 Tax=Pseudokineococcus sp. 1T1Z-3 TaxID=3132745 RepID=UPI0030DB5C35